MIIEIVNIEFEASIKSVLQNNNISNYQLKKKKDRWLLEVNEEDFEPKILEKIIRHFSFYDLFSWSEKGLEDVIFWEKPERFSQVIHEFQQLFFPDDFDVIVSLEARGFILGGIFAQALKMPFLPIRKHKKLYETLSGTKTNFTNWKGEVEGLFLTNHPFSGKKAIFIDDLMDTGNSLKAAYGLLQKSHIQLKGAFYLANIADRSVKTQFMFPIRSLLDFYELTSI